MSATVLYIVYAGVFVSILLLIEGAYLLVRDQLGPTRDINRRMHLIRRKGDGRAALSLLKNEKEDGLEAIIRRFIPSLSLLLWTSGVSVSATRFFSLCLAIFFATTTISRLVFSAPIMTAVAIGFIIGLVLPRMMIGIKAGRRQQKFSKQLPDAIDLVVRGLEAGHPINPAMSLVAQEMPDPIGTELGVAVDEMTYGLNMKTALENMSQRFPNADLRYLVVAIQIQKDTGGNLVETLMKLSDTIRKRFNMYSKIRVASAEGRLSGLVVGAMPFIVGSIILIGDPEYFGIVKNDPWFIPMLSMSAILWIIGVFTIWWMIQIKV